MPSNHLILCRPVLLLLSIFPSIRVFSNESVLCIRWPKYWSFSMSPSNEYSGLISFSIDRFDLLAYPKDSQTSSPTPQFESINSSALCLLYGPAFTSILDHWENHSFDYKGLCRQSDVSALLSRFVITFFSLSSLLDNFVTLHDFPILRVLDVIPSISDSIPCPLPHFIVLPFLSPFSWSHVFSWSRSLTIHFCPTTTSLGRRFFHCKDQITSGRL